MRHQSLFSALPLKKILFVIHQCLLTGLMLFLLPGCMQIRAQSTAPPPPRDDNQSWNEWQLVTPLTKKADFTIFGVMRFGRDFARPVDERIGAGISFKPNKYITLTPTYLYIAQQPFAGRKIIEHRLIANITLKASAGRFNFTDRNLIERRVRHFSRDFTVYRNRLQIDHLILREDWKIRAYVADETWYDSSQSVWTRNRISAGLFRQFNQRFYGEIFYLRQNDGRARPGNVHAIGTLFRILLRDPP
jgi:hypothetical protein